MSGLKVIPGMAHFAGTGPDGKCCRDCFWWGDNPGCKRHKPQICSRHRAMRAGQGLPPGNARVPPGARACKYFNAREVNGVAADKGGRYV